MTPRAVSPRPRPPADRRTVLLAEFAGQLIAEYASFAGAALPHMRDDAAAEAAERVRQYVTEATARLADITTATSGTAAQLIDEYARRPGIDDAQRTILRAAVRIANGEDL